MAEISGRGEVSPSFRFPVPFSWKAGLLLLILFSIPRFVWVLHAAQTGNYQFVSLVFVIMAVAPFLLLSRSGRVQMGIKKPANAAWLVLGFAGGMLCCYLMYWIAVNLFGRGSENWLVYISSSYTQLPVLTAENRLVFFLIFALIGMTFSPIGEELFYRGLVHENFRKDFGDLSASVIDSTAFALVHLAHFGIIYSGGQFSFLFVPAIVWCISLFICCMWFGYARKKSGSVLGAILAHAGFNLMMNYLIFFKVLN